jgi:hypothetical protein
MKIVGLFDKENREKHFAVSTFDFPLIGTDAERKSQRSG